MNHSSDEILQNKIFLKSGNTISKAASILSYDHFHIRKKEEISGKQKELNMHTIINILNYNKILKDAKGIWGIFAE